MTSVRLRMRRSCTCADSRDLLSLLSLNRSSVLNCCSHTCTIVRECSKADDASPRGKREIRPLATPKPLNRSSQKSCARDYVMDIYRHAKFSRDPSRGFFSPYARNCASKCLLGFFFSGFFQQPTAYTPEPIFTGNTSNDAVPRKDVPFRGSETKI